MLYRHLLKLTYSHTPDVKNLESISAKPFFKHYKNAINLSLQNRLQQANEQFVKSLAEIRESKENQLEHFSYILRRIAGNLRRMGKMKEAEERLYQVIKYKREAKVNPALIYDDYDILFRHLLSYNLQKSIKLCKALLTKQKQDLPISHTKLFNFNLGTAYLLASNYPDSKARLSKCIDSDPLGKLKSYAYNNLALACWWHKNPIQVVREDVEGDVVKVQRDYGMVKELFARAIQVAEGLTGQANQVQKLMLAETLDFKKGALNQKLEFTAAPSLFPVYNLAKFYILNDPLQRLQILYWLQKSLSLSKTLNSPSQFSHILTQYSLLTNNLQPLLSQLPQLIEQSRSSQNFIDEATYCKIYANLLSKEGKGADGQEYLKRARVIESVLPAWSWKLRFVARDQLHFGGD